MIKRAIARLGLAARIGVAVAASVAAIQLFVTLVFVLNPPSFHPFYSARWLSGAVVEIIKSSRSRETEPAGVLGTLKLSRFASTARRPVSVLATLRGR